MSSYIPRVYKTIKQTPSFHYQKQVYTGDCPHCRTGVYIGNRDIRECKEEFIRSLCNHKSSDIYL